VLVAVDCRCADSSGIGVYLRGVLPWFLGSGNRFLLLGNRERLAEMAGGASNAEIAECNIKPFSLRELLFFPARLRKLINRCALYWTPYFNIPGGIKVPVCVTIHDIIFLDMPGITSKAGLAARRFFYRRAAGRSNAVFTVSCFSKERIRERLGRRLNVIVTYSAIQERILNFCISGAVKQNTVIFIGNIKKHKGLAVLLDAFCRLAEEDAAGDFRLVIAGSKDNFRTKDKTALRQLRGAAGGRISFTGFIDGGALCRLIAGAALLVQPSLYEGFCLPPLEAMVLGTKALISDIPVLREIYGDYPVTFFRAGDSADLKDKMAALLKKREVIRLPEELRTRYTFEKTAGRCLAAWEAAALR